MVISGYYHLQSQVLLMNSEELSMKHGAVNIRMALNLLKHLMMHYTENKLFF